VRSGRFRIQNLVQAQAGETSRIARQTIEMNRNFTYVCSYLHLKIALSFGLNRCPPSPVPASHQASLLNTCIFSGFVYNGEDSIFKRHKFRVFFDPKKIMIAFSKTQSCFLSPLQLRLLPKALLKKPLL